MESDRLREECHVSREVFLCLTCSKRNEAGYIAYTKLGFALNGDSEDEDPFWILELQVE